MQRYYAKKSLRTQVKSKRSETSMKQSRRYQETLKRFLATCDLCGEYVICYSSLPGEVNIAGLADVFSCALTRVAPNRQLTIHPFDSESEVSPYGFAQPVAEAPCLDGKEVGAVLVPGLAFDRRGVRLGYGQGYYDRFLARLGSDVLKVGVVTTLVDSVPQEPHDIAMTHLAFESEVTAV